MSEQTPDDILYPRTLPEGEDRFSWRKNIAPKLGLLAIGVIVVAVDTITKKGNTISEEVYRMRRTKFGSKVVPLVINEIADHLLERKPLEEDKIHQIAKLSPKKDKPKLDGSDRFDVFGTDD